MPDYVDVHNGEPITSECPHCHLPIYQSDSRRLSRLTWDTSERLYHAGCASLAEGIHWEREVKRVVDRLRGCGYIVEMKIIRPVR